MNIHRRELVKGAIAASLFAPFLRHMRLSAAGVLVPRLAIIRIEHGFGSASCTSRGKGSGVGPVAGATLKTPFAPLEPYKAQAQFIDDILGHIFRKAGHGSRGQLTGWGGYIPSDDNPKPYHESIDSYIDRILTAKYGIPYFGWHPNATLGKGALNLSFGAGGENNSQNLSFSKDGIQTLAPHENIKEITDALNARLRSLAQASGVVLPTPVPTPDARARADNEIARYLESELNAYKSKGEISSSEAEKLLAMGTAIASYKSSGSGAPAPQAPLPPGVIPEAAWNSLNGINDERGDIRTKLRWPAATANMLTLGNHALKYGLSYCATIDMGEYGGELSAAGKTFERPRKWSEPNGSVPYPNYHNQVAHWKLAEGGPDYWGSVDGTFEAYIAMQRNQMQLLVDNFLKPLADHKDEDGISALDKTIVLIMSEMSDASSHDVANLQKIVVGGGALGLAQGVHHAIPQKNYGRSLTLRDPAGKVITTESYDYDFRAGAVSEQDICREIVNVFERHIGHTPSQNWGNPDFNANRTFTLRKS